MRSFTKGFLKLVAWVVGILLVFVAVMRIFFVDMAVVGHNGMAPTMEAGDTILIWRHGEPKDLGDITICDHPVNAGELVMGRVVGKPGMVVEADSRHRLVVAGSIPDIDWQGSDHFVDTVEGTEDDYRRGVAVFGNVDHLLWVRDGAEFRMRSVEVQEGEIFLLGDNRTYVGQDSRYFGTIDPATCHGTVFMRLVPASDSPNDLGNGYLDIIH